MYYASGDLKIDFAGDDLFTYLWNLPETWVEEPNQARGGTSGVIRTTINQQTVYMKKQVGHIYRSVRSPWGRPTALRELAAYKVVNKIGITTPALLYCEARRVSGQWHTLLLTKALDGYFPLSDLPQRSSGIDSAAQGEVIMAVARTLAKLHRARWQHSSLYPTHIFVRLDGGKCEVALLDLEKVHRRLTVTKASRHDMQQFLRRQRCWDDAGIAMLMRTYDQALRGTED
jgi:tRNA A-37 threonylcarbamoyl transferase component Bud32